VATILIIDDDRALRRAIATALTDLGHETAEAADGEAALAWLSRFQADAVLLDLRMPGMDGMDVLRRIRAKPSPPPVAVLTAVPTSDNTIEAMRLGAADHLAKPIGRDGLRALLERMLPAAGTAAAPGLATDIPATDTKQGDLVGTSAAMRDIQKSIGLLADSDATVLLLGETGTGKEVVARAIHRHGRRARAPFVPVNCAAIPAELLESLLFGHVRGAFTGAVADRAGSFRDAQGGTLFLDEIGDMDMAMQAKLLRALQERVVTPVGGRPVPVDVRVISATHRDLFQAVRDGKFREDLYYRLGVVPVGLPPLRERLADIIPLAEHFLTLSAEAGPAKRLSSDAASRLLAYPWPGNVRELLNSMKRASTLVRRPVISAADLMFLKAPDGAPALPAGVADWFAGTLPEVVARVEIELIRCALEACGGNRAQAAEQLGIRRQLLYQKLDRYGLAGLSPNGTADVPGQDTPAAVQRGTP
jgi:DNA-binding NtrC family response regulator